MPEASLSFRLTWIGTADLDVRVRGPSGRVIAYFDPRSPSGGVLNTDCNIDPTARCEQPVETITWTGSAIPVGTFQFWARLMHPRDAPLPVDFTLDVWVAEELVRTQTGSLMAPGDDSFVWTFNYTGQH